MYSQNPCSKRNLEKVLVEKQNHPNHIRLHLIFSKKSPLLEIIQQVCFSPNITKPPHPFQFSHPKLLCFSFGTPSLGSPLVSLDTAIYRVRWGANDIFAHCGCSSVGHLMIEGFGQLTVSLWFSESSGLLVFGSNLVDDFYQIYAPVKWISFPRWTWTKHVWNHHLAMNLVRVSCFGMMFLGFQVCRKSVVSRPFNPPIRSTRWALTIVLNGSITPIHGLING